MLDDAKTIEMLERIEGRLDRIEDIVATMKTSSRKSLEWVGILSEHIDSLDEFREEVREKFEPLADKLDCTDEILRILRHATVDVSRRIERLERLERTKRISA